MENSPFFRNILPYYCFCQTFYIHLKLTLSPPNKSLSAKFLDCFIFQSASMSLKDGENDHLASHPDPSCLNIYGTLVVIGGLRVK